MNYPKYILTEKDKIVTFDAYCVLRASSANETYHSKEIHFTPETIRELARICDSSEDELDPDSTPPCVFDVCEDVCQTLIRSSQYEFPQEAIEVISAELLSPIVPTPPELEMVEAAKNSRFSNFSNLEKKFDFGPEGTQIEPRDGHVPTPKDYAEILGAGVDMGHKAMWIVGEAVNKLLYLGFENVLYQIASDLKMSYSTVSSWHRVCERIKPSDRIGLPPTVAQEIACARYSSEEEENQKRIDEFVRQAKEEGWNATETRNHIHAARMPRKKRRSKKAEYKSKALLSASLLLRQALASLTQEHQDLKDKIANWIDENCAKKHEKSHDGTQN